MDIYIGLIVTFLTVIIFTYGSDIFYLFQWFILSGLTEQNSLVSPVSQLPPEKTSPKRVKESNHKNKAINKIMSDFTSSDRDKRLAATELIKRFPPEFLEEKLLPYLSNSNTDSEVSASAAEVLLENGREEIIPVLAQFFSKRENGIAGFLDDRDYNKVVNLFK